MLGVAPYGAEDTRLAVRRDPFGSGSSGHDVEVPGPHDLMDPESVDGVHAVDEAGHLHVVDGDRLAGVVPVERGRTELAVRLVGEEDV